MLTRLYQWTLAKAAHRHAERWLFAVSFMESSFFPIPPHPLLGLMCLARPERAVRFGLICTIASVLGGLFGYAIGFFLYEAVGGQILHALGLAEKFPIAACYLRDYGAEIILIKGATPIPFKLITITAGFIGLSLFTFLWASIVSRGFQFMLVGILFWKFGRPIKAFIEKYLALLSALFLLLVVGGFVAISTFSGTGHESDACSRATMATVR
ncbi:MULTISPECIES: YqaA family protein [Alphaproteobacteria]|uniref:DedA family protein n=1 Tax=Sphingobium naphthae TaxID=1886786 RepID=A0ABU3ZV96_9SPHN|nr:YqaA family protein [Sphingobium naphthae]MAN11456.1 cytochrome B [Sphingobium sp.]MEC7932790.1 YqaA family protein [Pseudomonadota bacterium]PDH69442.1 MAG: cytochrome B [Sphingomonadaceae bacterium MED-G03]MCC4251943.1 DedA family protein [Sphingobium naphthae]MDV5823448.1 DedA family protein [Sphingobium naphthae]